MKVNVKSRLWKEVRNEKKIEFEGTHTDACTSFRQMQLLQIYSWFSFDKNFSTLQCINAVGWIDVLNDVSYKFYIWSNSGKQNEIPYNVCLFHCHYSRHLLCLFTIPSFQSQRRKAEDRDVWIVVWNAHLFMSQLFLWRLALGIVGYNWFLQKVDIQFVGHSRRRSSNWP